MASAFNRLEECYRLDNFSIYVDRRPWTRTSGTPSLELRFLYSDDLGPVWYLVYHSERLLLLSLDHPSFSETISSGTHHRAADCQRRACSDDDLYRVLASSHNHRHYSRRSIGFKLLSSGNSADNFQYPRDSSITALVLRSVCTQENRGRPCLSCHPCVHLPQECQACASYPSVSVLPVQTESELRALLGETAR